ncbi:MAG TPA: exo-beta-N-acetylmuramidase NamZ domain-containing protein, partial [Polyangiales bacterium]|nr:exo-beta-N-acetylmuramidase NamZ domain-containing protein [Polyangiales bacterium]
MLRVATGLERIASGDESVLSELRGRKLGLCAHPASVDSRFTHARRVFDTQRLELRALFGPEHGYGGEAQDMISVRDGDAQESLPVYSLYGPTEAELSPRPEQLEGLDAIVIDLQDVGARYYTFVWTAVLVLRAAAQRGVQTIVLDRPNPLGGEILEGAPQRAGYRSFVGLCDVPVRHGMTA